MIRIEWAVVGSPDREYQWILARTPHLDDQRAAEARHIAGANGFDVDRLIQSAQEENALSLPETHHRLRMPPNSCAQIALSADECSRTIAFTGSIGSVSPR